MAETVADRHNNPLNMKYGPATQQYVANGDAELGEPAQDGGQFLKFTSPEAGYAAANDLLFNGPYKDMPADSALKKWSSGGYGASILPELQGDTPLKSLTADKRSRLIAAMAQREGFSAASRPASAPAQNFDPTKILDGVQADNKVKADAWEAFHAARNDAEFQLAFKDLPLPNEVKAQLWEAKNFHPDQHVPAKIQALTPAIVASRAAETKAASVTNQPQQVSASNGGLNTTNVKSVLDAPLYFMTGAEQSLGLDPAHPFTSLPDAAWGAVKGGYQLLRHPFDTGTAIAKNFGEHVEEAKKAWDNQDLAAAAEAIGKAYGIARPIAGAVPGVKRFVGAPEIVPEIGTEAIRNAASEAATAKASQIGAKVLAPKVGPNKVRFGNIAADIAPEVLQKTKGITTAGVKADIEQNLEAAKGDLDNFHDNVDPNRIVDTENLVENLEKRRAQLDVEGANHQPFTPEAHTSQAEALDTAIKEAKNLGEGANFQNLRNLRIAWDGPAKMKYMPSTAADILKAQGRANGYMKAAGELRDYMAEAEPGSPEINANYHLWKQADDVMQAAEETERTRPTGLRTAAGRIAGAAIARGAGGGMFSELVGAAVGPAVDWALTQTSTAAKIWAARQLARLGSALRVGDGASSDAILAAIHDRMDLEGGPPPGLKGSGLGPNGEGPVISPPAPFSSKVKQLGASRQASIEKNPARAAELVQQTRQLWKERSALADEVLKRYQNKSPAARKALPAASPESELPVIDVPFRQAVQPSSGETVQAPGTPRAALPPGQYNMPGEVEPPVSTIPQFLKDRQVIDNHSVRFGVGKVASGPDYNTATFKARLEAGAAKATPAARADYVDKMRTAAETHYPAATPAVDAAAEALKSGDVKDFAAKAEIARKSLSSGYAKRLAEQGAASVGVKPMDFNISRAKRVIQGIGNPDIEAAASTEMQRFAKDVREMQSHREAVTGGGSMKMESNAEGKKIDEAQEEDWGKVGKKLGVIPPDGLDMTPGKIADAIEKGKGKDFDRIQKAFRDAAKQEFSAYRAQQLESGVGPPALRQRALSLLRQKLKS